MNNHSETPNAQAISVPTIGGTSEVPAPTVSLRSLPAADDPINSLVGQIAIKTAHIEDVLDVIIWRLAGLSGPLGACLTSEMTGLFVRFEVVRKLLVERKASATLLEQTTQLQKDIRKVSGLRNRAIHDPWYLSTAGAGTDEHAQFRKKPDRGSAYGMETSELAAIEANITYLTEAYGRFTQLKSTIFSELPS